jgi:hypothetical protein
MHAGSNVTKEVLARPRRGTAAGSTTARRTNSCADAGEPIAEGSRLAAPASLAYRQVTG